MRLFISYSRKNKDWVFEFYERLNGTPRHSVWIDRFIPTGHDWWETILSEIEKADVFIMVLSPPAAESKYCLGELEYAHQLAKPIFPIMLEDCDQPEIIQKNRIQYHKVIDPDNIDAVLREVEVGLYEFQDRLSAKPKRRISRPSEPSLPPQELYEQALAAIEQEDYLAAEARFEQVLQADSAKILKHLTEGKLTDVKPLVERQRDYMEVVSLFQNATTRNDIVKAWKFYAEEHGTIFDPENIEGYIKALRYIEIRKERDERELYLQYLRLKFIPPEIIQLYDLTWLSLVGNRLSTLPLEICMFPKLTFLDLRGNGLQELPPEIMFLSHLRELNLYDNELSNVPHEVGQLANLEKLHLDANQLSNLPSEIGQLINLTKLGLMRNQFSSFPIEVGQLANLEHLHLDANQLSNLSPEIGQLAKLTTLSLVGNKLTTLPSEIGRLGKLKHLYLSSNCIRELPLEIGQLQQLRVLLLFENDFDNFPIEIIQSKQLRQLSLDSNNITTLSPEIGNLSELEYLNLRNNQLCILPAEIGQLVNLTQLLLGKNQLITLPPELGTLDNLMDFQVVEGNPLSDLPPDVVAGGDWVVLEWLREQAKAKGLI